MRLRETEIIAKNVLYFVLQKRTLL